MDEATQPWPTYRKLAAYLFWVALMAAFVAVSAPKILRGISTNSVHFAGPFYSTDNFLYFDIREINASERLIASFDVIPSTKRILIFVRNDDRRIDLVGKIIAYLAWPHPVQIIDVTHAGWENEPGAGDFASTGAFVFCGVTPPPSWPRGERFGEVLEVLPVARVNKQ